MPWIKYLYGKAKPWVSWKGAKISSYLIGGGGVAVSLATEICTKEVATTATGIAVAGTTAYSIFKNLETAQHISQEIQRAKMSLDDLYELAVPPAEFIPLNSNLAKTERELIRSQRREQLLRTFVTEQSREELKRLLQEKIKQKSYRLAIGNACFQVTPALLAGLFYSLSLISEGTKHLQIGMSICIFSQFAAHLALAHELNTSRTKAHILSTEIEKLDNQLILPSLEKIASLKRQQQTTKVEIEDLKILLVEKNQNLLSIQQQQAQIANETQSSEIKDSRLQSLQTQEQQTTKEIQQNEKSKDEKEKLSEQIDLQVDGLVNHLAYHLIVNLSFLKAQFEQYSDILSRIEHFQHIQITAVTQDMATPAESDDEAAHALGARL